MSIPNNAYAIIIGSMKCGTTSLYDYLQRHPQICPAVEKEPRFFCQPQHNDGSRGHYSDLWPSFDKHTYALEASTTYTKCHLWPNVAQAIYNYGIQPKLIYLVRNPFDRIVSHYYQNQKEGLLQVDITGRNYIETSKYYLQLEQYSRYFPREQFLILDSDDLHRRPRALLEETYRFLGLPSTYFPQTYAAKNARPTRLEFKLIRYLRKMKLITYLRYVPSPVRMAGKALMRKTSAPPQPVLTADKKEFIHNELRQDMVNFHRVYGFDVRKWGFEA